jgi:hypothetical protein
MSIILGPINEGEQAVEKVEDHTLPLLVQLVDVIFQRIWKTRITIDISERI